MVATATSVAGAKTNFGSFICSRSSTNPANSVRGIGPVRAEIIGLTEIVKINAKQRQNTCLAAGGLISK